MNRGKEIPVLHLQGLSYAMMTLIIIFKTKLDLGFTTAFMKKQTEFYYLQTKGSLQKTFIVVISMMNSYKIKTCLQRLNTQISISKNHTQLILFAMKLKPRQMINVVLYQIQRFGFRINLLIILKIDSFVLKNCCTNASMFTGDF